MTWKIINEKHKMGLLNWLKKLGQEDDLAQINALDIRKDMDAVEAQAKEEEAEKKRRDDLRRRVHDLINTPSTFSQPVYRSGPKAMHGPPGNAGAPGVAIPPGGFIPMSGVTYPGVINGGVLGGSGGGAAGYTATITVDDDLTEEDEDLSALDQANMLKKLRSFGYHLTGSRRMLAKYRVAFETLDALDHKNRVGLIQSADWDLFTDTNAILDDQEALRQMGFRLVVCSVRLTDQFAAFHRAGKLKPRDPEVAMYNDKMTEVILRHNKFPIEITGKSNLDVYMKTFEGLKFVEYAAYLWKSNPTRGFSDTVKHKAFISAYYDCRFFVIAAAMDMADPGRFGNDWDPQALEMHMLSILGEKNYNKLKDNHAKILAAVGNI